MVRTDNPAIAEALDRAEGLRRLARLIDQPGRFSTIRYQAMRGFLSEDLAAPIADRFGIDRDALMTNPYE